MKTFLTKTLLAAVLGLGTLAASVPAASAAGLDVTVETVGYRNGFLQVQEGDWGRGDGWNGERRGGDRWDRRDDRRHGNRWGGGRGRCSPGLAVEKAREFGLRRASIADMSPRRVVVEGFRRGEYTRMVFANERGCPAMWR